MKLDLGIDYGASGGPGFKTQVINSVATEQRNLAWNLPRHSYQIGERVLDLEEYQELLGFFQAVYGQLTPFRFRDWSDYRATNQVIGTGNGTATQFQLVKRYGSLVRKIIYPIGETVVSRVNNVITAVTVNESTGVITFATAPGDGLGITASFEFDVPVRFAQDNLPVTLEAVSDTDCLVRLGSVQLVEVRT